MHNAWQLGSWSWAPGEPLGAPLLPTCGLARGGPACCLVVHRRELPSHLSHLHSSGLGQCPPWQPRRPLLSCTHMPAPTCLHPHWLPTGPDLKSLAASALIIAAPSGEPPPSLLLWTLAGGASLHCCGCCRGQAPGSDTSAAAAVGIAQGGLDAAWQWRQGGPARLAAAAGSRSWEPLEGSPLPAHCCTAASSANPTPLILPPAPPPPPTRPPLAGVFLGLVAPYVGRHISWALVPISCLLVLLSLSMLLVTALRDPGFYPRSPQPMDVEYGWVGLGSGTKGRGRLGLAGWPAWRGKLARPNDGSRGGGTGGTGGGGSDSSSGSGIAVVLGGRVLPAGDGRCCPAEGPAC